MKVKYFSERTKTVERSEKAGRMWGHLLCISGVMFQWPDESSPFQWVKDNMFWFDTENQGMVGVIGA